jgi:hypothetical protein
MRYFLLVLLGLSLVAGTEAANLHARLVRASNDRDGKDAQLADIEKPLREKLGYKFYRQLGSRQTAIVAGKMERLNLGEGFVVFVTGKGEEKDQQVLDLEWYSGKTLLLRSTVKIGVGRHLFVKGPDVGAESLALAVTVRE